MPLELVAISYPDESTADRAATELARCADELAIDPDCAAVIVCERDGSIRLITSRRAGARSRWLGFWGGFLEALTDRSVPAFDPEFRRRLDDSLSPGTSALLVLLPGGESARLTDALSPHDGIPIRCTLSEEQLASASERR